MTQVKYLSTISSSYAFEFPVPRYRQQGSPSALHWRNAFEDVQFGTAGVFCLTF